MAQLVIQGTFDSCEKEEKNGYTKYIVSIVQNGYKFRLESKVEILLEKGKEYMVKFVQFQRKLKTGKGKFNVQYIDSPSDIIAVQD